MAVQNRAYQHVQNICGHKCVPKPWHGESARMNEGGSLGLIVCLPNQCVFLQGLKS